jgi:hypothetical protein
VKAVNKLGVLVGIVVIPYLALVFYLAVPGRWNLNALPLLARLGLLIYFLLSIAVLAIGIRRLKNKQAGVSRPAGMSTESSRAIYRVKRLLVLYLIGVPIGLVVVFVQRIVPIKFALLGVVVSLLVMGATWRSLSQIKGLGGK